MWKIVRSIVAVIVGFAAASAVMMVIETVNGRVLYPELDVDIADGRERPGKRPVRARGLTAGQFHFGPVDARLPGEILIDALILLLPALQYTS
jgi:hypothetical protein